MSIGMPDINKYFKVAMSYPVARLQAVMRNQDHSIPMVAAMAAYEVKSPMEIAAKAQQAAQKQATVSIRDKLASEGEEEKNGMLPDNLMMAMQQQQQGSLPENTGIGRLPAPNMQGMGHANGGIIAFDDGGYVPGYAGEDGSLVRNNLMSSVPPPKSSFSRRITDKVNTLAGEEGYQQEVELFKPIDTDKEIAKLQQQLNTLPANSPERGLIESRLNALLKRPKASETPPIPQAGVDKLIQANRDMQNMPREVAPSAPPTEKRKAPVASGIPTVSPADTEQQMADVMSRISGTRDAEIKSQYEDLEKKTATGIDALRTERERGKPAGKAYEGLERELAEEKTATKGKEDKNLQMALVNAGLAIAGGTSRYAMENIGKGALVGTKQYMDGLEKLEAAAKERRKMTAMIDEARRAEARGDFKEKNDFETKAFELGINSRKASIDALSKIYDTDKKAAVDIFNRLEQDKHADLRNRETNATTREIYKNRAGGGEYNVAWDNATNAIKAAMQANPMLALEYQKNPQKYQADFDALLQKALSKSTTTGGATMPGGGNLKFLGFEKQ